MLKESFILYTPFYEPIKGLSLEEKGLLLEMIFEYQINGTEKKLTSQVKMAFEFFKNQFRLDEEKSKRGKFHWNWKGGITPKNHSIRQSTEYSNWRKEVFERDEYMCQKCFKYEKPIEAHHIASFAEYPELRFEIENGITLCKKCHKKAHRGGGKK